MKLLDIPNWGQVCIAYFESFRRLGFSSDDIFFRIATGIPSGVPEIMMTIEKPKGTPVFVVSVCKLSYTNLTAEECGNSFIQYAEMWNDPVNKDDCTTLFKNQLDRGFPLDDLALTMQAKGLVDLRRPAPKHVN